MQGTMEQGVRSGKGVKRAKKPRKKRKTGNEMKNWIKGGGGN